MLTITEDYSFTQLLDGIRKMTDSGVNSPAVQTLATQITQGQADKVQAVYNWSKTNIKYEHDPIVKGEESEQITSPNRYVLDFQEGIPLAGDCDDFAVFNTAMFRCLGMQSNVVLIDQTGGGYDHALCRVYSDVHQKWMYVDSSTDKYPLGWEETSFKEYIVS